MLMVSVKNLSVSFGARLLFVGVSLQLESGQVTALIGPNGSGKTTLLRTIIGEIQPEEGSVWLRPGARVSYLPQSASEPQPGTPLALCLEALAPLGLDYEHEALACLGRHGISPEEAGLPIESLSSGQRTRVGIACATAGDPDVLILDEPTNHLDAAGVDALAAWIKRSRAAVLVVSHDRYFLDAVADYVAELATDDPRQPARLRTFPGNYSAYRRQLQLEWESAAKLYRHQEEERRLAEAARRRMEWFASAPAAGQDDFARAKAKKVATRAWRRRAGWNASEPPASGSHGSARRSVSTFRRLRKPGGVSSWPRASRGFRSTAFRGTRPVHHARRQARGRGPQRLREDDAPQDAGRGG